MNKGDSVVTRVEQISVVMDKLHESKIDSTSDDEREQFSAQQELYRCLFDLTRIVGEQELEIRRLQERWTWWKRLLGAVGLPGVEQKRIGG